MKRLLAAVSLALLALLTACGGDDNQSGDSNTDSQVTQPPLPSATP